MGFFTRLIAGLVAASTLGAGLAGTAGAVDTTGTTGDTKGVVKLASDDTSGLPDHLVNGDFEYPGANVLSKNRYDEKASWNWWGVSRKDKMVYDTDHETQWVSLPSTFDSDRFAWDSTEVAGVQNGSSQWHTNEVELQRDSRTGNMYGELCAYQANTSIRQYIRTTPGVLYKVRLKHASLSRDYLDKMQVLIGPAGNEQPVRMTRVGSQNGLDATGESTASTTVSTHASNEMEIKDGQGGTPYSSRNHDGQWATYEGVYVATSDVTSFTFKSVDAKAWNLGNLLDDIVFDKAYRLSYDKNASDASGQVPSDTAANTVKQTKAKSSGGVRLAADRTDGKVSDLVQRTTTHEDGSVTVRTVDTTTDVVSGCQVYYPAGQRITLATMAKDDDCWDSSMLSRPGHTQLGWNRDRNATAAQPEVTMVEGGMTVYAVWVGNPVLTYDTNKPNTWNGQMPSTPASVSVSYNTAAADGSGWQSGDTSKIRGYRFLGWYAGPQDDAGLYDWNTLLTGNVTVYAHWQRLQANVVYDANGGTGSHANTTGWQYSDVTVPSDTSKSFKRDGYYFKYWNTQKDGKGTTYKDSAQVPLQDKNVTLYAIWAPYHTVITETGGIGLPVLVTGGIVLLVMGIGSTVMLTRRMRGER
ncbi:MAG: InlB B-repeat-containing protein [Bifidobacterium catenulatum]